jgi:hypothetical protein
MNHNYRAWRDFFEVKKEVDDQEDLFLSTSNDIDKYHDKLYDHHKLKKSESLDGSLSPSMMDMLLIKSSSDSKKMKIKSNKDLANVRNAKSIPKTSNLKSFHKKKKPKLTDKLCWKYLGSKENIKKYMKKKRKKMIKQEVRDKIFDFKKQSKICHNLRALHRYTRLQTKRVGAFKERSASAQHKLSTFRRINNSNVIDDLSNSFFNNLKNNKNISTRKFSNLNPNDLQGLQKRTKN